MILSRLYLCVLLLKEVLFVAGHTKCPGKCVNGVTTCQLLGGKIVGYCTNEQACCDYNKTTTGSCNTIVNKEHGVAYFRSPLYPKESSGDLICTFTLQLSPETVGIRLDFMDYKLDGVPSNPVNSDSVQYPICDSDMMFLKGFKNWSPDPRCGNLTGYSILVQSEADQKNLTVLFVMSSIGYKWNIRLTQLWSESINKLKTLLHNKTSKHSDGTGTVAQTLMTEIPYLTERQRPSNYFYTNRFNLHYEPVLFPWPPFPFLYHSSWSDLTIHPTNRVSRSSRTQPVEENGQIPFHPIAKIAGGEDADAYSIPWQATIQTVEHYESTLCGEIKNMSLHQCGGTILDEKTILTAAHCFLSSARYPHPTIRVEDLKVVVGDLDMCTDDEVPFTKEHSIERILLHFNYFSKEIINDLAIVHLKNPIEFNKGVRPIQLPDSDFNIHGKRLLLSGWGSFTVQEDNLTFPRTLQRTSDLLLLTDEECTIRQRQYFKFNTINNDSNELPPKYSGVLDRGICVRGGGDLGEAGFGDSGGPLVAFSDDDGEDEPSPILIGVVSHMRPEIENDTSNTTFNLDYFVKVSSFTNWILMGMIGS